MKGALPNLDAQSAAALGRALKFLMISAERSAAFLRCLPITTQDRRLGHIEIATKSTLILQYGLSGEAASAMARAFREGLIFLIARPAKITTEQSPGTGTDDEEGA